MTTEDRKRDRERNHGIETRFLHCLSVLMVTGKESSRKTSEGLV